MLPIVRGFGLVASLAFVYPFASASQVAAQTTSAHVYIQVQGRAGAVYGFSASSSGQLTAIPGSPFKPGSRIIGSNGSQFFTLGDYYMHSYAVASNGAIGSQLSKVNVYNFAGSSCGNYPNAASGAELDHTGKTVYVMLSPGPPCVAYQSYKVNGDGSFTFDGDTEEPQNLYGSDLESVTFGLPSVLGNETYGYAEYPKDSSGAGKLIGFRRESSGMLQLMQFNETDPSGNTASEVHDPDASPTGNYVVAQVNSSFTSPTHLASYTVDSSGNLSTTNTFSNMPTTTLVPDWNTFSQYASHSNSMFSPDGNLFVVYGGGGAQGSTANGIKIYHFNGANPLTPYKTLLAGTPIDQVAWDRSNHLYAISNAGNKLWVFTVTSTSVTLNTSRSIGAPFSMVVSK